MSSLAADAMYKTLRHLTAGIFRGVHAEPKARTSFLSVAFVFRRLTCSGCSFERLNITHLVQHINMKERRNTQPMMVRCKLVLVGEVQCGKTAMLQVLAKDCYPEVMEHHV